MTTRIRYLAPTRTHSFAALPAALLIGALALAGCGGGAGKGADEPAAGDDDDGDGGGREESKGDTLIPPEKFDAIQRYFERKSRSVSMSRCFTDAIDAGEVSPRATGRATVVMVINTSGRPTKVRVTKIAPRSAKLEQCIIKEVESFTVTTLPEPIDYSYTFGFGTL